MFALGSREAVLSRLVRAMNWLRSFNTVLLVVIVSACASLACGQSTSTEASSSTETASEASESGQPEYAFETGPVTDWLVLGPIVRGEEFADPVEKLVPPKAGASVVLPNGAMRTWTHQKAGPRGALNCGQLHSALQLTQLDDGEPVQQNADHTVYYAYCKIRGDLGTVRQLLVGLDDGGRAWLDGEQVIDDVMPGWLRFYEHSIPVDFSDEIEHDLLFELHNWTGGFMLHCYGGYQLRGRAVFRDGISPVDDAAITISVEGEQDRVVATDATGQFTATAIPFGQPAKLSCLGSAVVLPPFDNPLFAPEQTVDDVLISVTPPFDFSVDISRLQMPPGLYEVILEAASGELLVANKADRSIYTYNGRSFELHPAEALRGFTHCDVTQMVESPSGELWISTDGDGLFRYSGGELEQWTASEVGEECYALEVLSSGDVLASFRLKKGSPDHAVWRISPGSSELDSIDLPQCNPIWSILEREHPTLGNELWLVPRLGRIIAKSDSGERLVDVPENSELSDVVPGESGELWFAGLGLFRLDAREQWQHLQIAAVDYGQKLRHVHRSPDDAVWFVSTNAVYCLENGVMNRVVTPANSTSDVYTCLARDGTLLLAERSGIVHSVKKSRVREYGTRFGIQTEETTYLSKGEGRIYISQFSPQAFVLQDGSFTEIRSDRTNVNGEEIGYASQALTIHGLSNNRLIAAPAFHAASGRMMNTTQPPLLRNEGGDWQAIERSIWEEQINAYTFALELKDGRVLLGSRQGLAEVVDGELVQSGVLDDLEPVGMPLAGHEDTQGNLWIVTCHGKLIRCTREEKSVLEFPDTTFCSGTVMCEHDGYIWIGNSSGLFRASISGELFEEVSDPQVKDLSVVGLETEVVPGQLWVIGRHGEVLVANEETRFAELVLLDQDDVRVVNSTVTDNDGRLWMATDAGLLSFLSDQTRPILSIQSLNATPLSEVKKEEDIAVECDDRLAVALAARDNDEASVYVRYRINGAQWNYPAGTVAETVTLVLDEPGDNDIEFQAYDGEWNLSNIQSQQIRSFRPIWRSPVFRISLVCLVVGALALASYLMVQNERARRSRDQMREQLLVDASAARSLAEETSRERAMLLARVCHDLRNPLGVVGIVRDLLASNEQAGNIPQLTELLDKSASNMKYLTDQLLTYAKSRAEMDDEPLAQVDVGDFIADFSASAQIRLRSSDVDFSSQVASGTPDRILTNSDVLREILGNIFDNAVRHTPEGAIKLDCASAANESVRFRISDTGTGMKPEFVETVFEPFFRGDKTSPIAEGSVGLGMYIVHELTNRLGGTVAVESEVGVGTTVSLDLPIKPLHRIPNTTSEATRATKRAVPLQLHRSKHEDSRVSAD